MGRLLLAHLFQRAAAIDHGDAFWMQRRVDVLVVDGQQAAAVGRVGEREEMHAVVVVAGLPELGLPIVAGIRLPLGCVGMHRIAPGEEHPGAVARRHLDTVEMRVELGRDTFEAEQRIAPGRGSHAGHPAAEKGDAGQAEPTLEQPAPAVIDRLLQRHVAARIDRLVVMSAHARVKIGEILFHRKRFLSRNGIIRCGNGRCSLHRARQPRGLRRCAAGSESSWRR